MYANVCLQASTISPYYFFLLSPSSQTIPSTRTSSHQLQTINQTKPNHATSFHHYKQMKPPSYGNSWHKLPSPAPLESPSYSPSTSQNHHRTSTPNSPLAFMRFLQMPLWLPTTQPPLPNCNSQSGGKHHRTKQGCYRSQGGFGWTRAGKCRAELRH